MEVDDDRHFSMSICSLGPSTLPRSSSSRTFKATNDASEFEVRAQNATQHERIIKKSSFLQSDVIGSTSKPLTRTRNTRDNSLYIDDIDGARPRVTNRILITKRRVNPLQPEYDLPSFETAKPYEPKFIRHTMDFSDIEGTQSKPLLRCAPRDSTNKVDDIVGAQANWRSRADMSRFKRDPKDIMQVDDISRRSRYVDKTDRMTDPMNPVYQVNGMVSYDDPKYTKPRKALPYFPESSLLLTKDINTGPDAKGSFRREYSRTNYIADIKGTEPDSIKHSIVTTRVTNPLAPVYQSLDYGEPLSSGLIPLLPCRMIFAPTLRPLMPVSGDIKDHHGTQSKVPADMCDANHSSGRMSAGELQNTSSSGAYYNNRAESNKGDDGGNDQDSSGYYESKEFDETETKAAMDGVDVTFLTEPYVKNDAEKRKSSSSSSRCRLNLEDVNESSSRYSSQNNGGIASTYSCSNRDYCDNNAGRQSFRNEISNRGDFKASSRCGTGNRESARSKEGSSIQTLTTPAKIAGEVRYQRARQEEIDSVRNL